MKQGPIFLTRNQIDAIHRDQIEAWGGLHGIRNEDGLESAIAQPQNVYCYAGGDLCEIAAAYAFHLAESQAYLDGNKRTGVQAALDSISRFKPTAFQAVSFQQVFCYDRHECTATVTQRRGSKQSGSS